MPVSTYRRLGFGVGLKAVVQLRYSKSTAKGGGCMV
jgi:hypothetical protein